MAQSLTRSNQLVRNVASDVILDVTRGFCNGIEMARISAKDINLDVAGSMADSIEMARNAAGYVNLDVVQSMTGNVNVGVIHCVDDGGLVA